MSVGKIAGAARPVETAPEATKQPHQTKFRLAPVGDQPALEPSRPAGPLSAAPPARGPEEGAGVRRALTRIMEDEKAVDRGLRAAMAGRQLSAQDLIVLQAKVIQYSQELEVASRVVEKVTSAVKEVMRTQV
jgi:flagellar hook-basal body complex protein FliE